MIFAVLVVPASVTEIVAVVFDVTFFVLIAKVADVLPASTVTVAGTGAEVELLDSVITSPPVGAALLIVIVPVAATPPFTLTGLTLTDTESWWC